MTSLYVLGLLTEHLVLTLVVCAAGVLVSAAAGVRDRVLLLLSGLVTYGVLSLLVFWVYLAGAAVGHAFAIVALLGSFVAAAVAAVVIHRRRGGPVLAPLLPPVAFYASWTLLLAAMGYLRGGTSAQDGAGRMRFVPGLPVDNALPYYFALQLRNATRPLPHYLAKPWQASDRPPLQTGVYLLQQGVLGHDSFNQYQAVGMLSQSLWVFGVWAFMMNARMPARAVALALAVTAFSGFTIVNSFFVWPKLFPAAYLMVAAAAVLGPGFDRFRRSWLASAGLGLCVGCAMMGHPGSLFVAIGLAVAALTVRAWPSWRLVVGGGAGVLVAYLPWVAFGKYYLPPGDYLEKWQLANARNYFDKRTLGQAIADSYRNAGVSGTVHNKLANLRTPLTDSLRYPAEIWDAVREHRLSLNGTGSMRLYKVELSAYFYYVPALGLMSLGIVLFLAKAAWLRWSPDRPSQQAGEAESALTGHRAAGRSSASPLSPVSVRMGLVSIVCLLVNWVIWAAVLFGPDATTIHQGSYFLEPLGFCVGVMGWWWVSRRLAVALVVLQAVGVFWIYGLQPPALVAPKSPILSHPLHSMMAMLVGALLLVVGSLWWIGQQPQWDAADPAESSGQRPTSEAAGLEPALIT